MARKRLYFLKQTYKKILTLLAAISNFKIIQMIFLTKFKLKNPQSVPFVKDPMTLLNIYLQTAIMGTTRGVDAKEI